MPRTSKARSQIIELDGAVELLSARVTLMEAILVPLMQRLDSGDKKLAAIAIDVAAAKYQPLLSAPGSPLAEVLAGRMRQIADAYQKHVSGP